MLASGRLHVPLKHVLQVAPPCSGLGQIIPGGLAREVKSNYKTHIYLFIYSFILFIYMYIYIYFYIYIYIYLFISMYLHILNIYIYTCIYMCIYIKYMMVDQNSFIREQPFFTNKKICRETFANKEKKLSRGFPT